MSSHAIRPARPADLPRVRELLAAADLPVAGVEEALPGFLVAESASERDDGSARSLSAVAGLEVHWREGVLRSVAVDPSLRGQGLGARLTDAVLERARAAGLRRVYLLTTTAEDYFPRHGFHRVPRESASAEVRDSIEFREACPASAVAMVLELE